jgi:hypothetical protein
MRISKLMIKSIKISTIVCSSIVLMIANSVNAQESLIQNSVGPVIEFGNTNTLFGLQGKFGISPEFSARPIILFGDGTLYGLSLTYDFKFPDSKISGYVGPRILFGSASRSAVVQGVPVTGTVSGTQIALTAGGDYAISPNFTAGLNVSYAFSRSSTFSGSDQLVGLPVVGSVSSSTGNFNVGINVGYNF